MAYCREGLTPAVATVRENRSRPRSLFFPAAGGLGFGLPAAVGVALPDPARPVVAGSGTAPSSTASRGCGRRRNSGCRSPFLVLRNGGYDGLRGFLAPLGVTTRHDRQGDMSVSGTDP